jgi:hypothetical protein
MLLYSGVDGSQTATPCFNTYHLTRNTYRQNSAYSSSFSLGYGGAIFLGNYQQVSGCSLSLCPSSPLTSPAIFPRSELDNRFGR